MGGTDTSDSTTAITSAGDGRLRPFRVDGFEIPMPSNERWYQHREAVKLFLRLQKEGAKLKVVYNECARREMMTVNYPCLMKKLDKVKIGVAQGFDDAPRASGCTPACRRQDEHSRSRDSGPHGSY